MKKLILENIIIANRAPFDAPLELILKENEIVVLSAVNGMGKTTILSHIVDAFYEIAKLYFHNEFNGIERQYYRVSSQIFNKRSSEPSFVYLRFSTNDGQSIDYVDVRGDDSGKCTHAQYENAVRIVNKIPFGNISKQLDQGGNAKLVLGVNSAFAKDVFHGNVLTYFPSYRYELPGYLNDPYKARLKFKKESNFLGYLPNPIEVATGLQGLMNWIMDVVLDIRQGNVSKQQYMFDNNTYMNLCKFLSEILYSKFESAPNQGLNGQPNIPMYRFGVGPRNSGLARISVHTNDESAPPIYPTLSMLSSGESGLLCLFGELLRQADSIGANMTLMNVQGIVLIDEIDKHLHVRLQRDVLPKLITMFPNVQFITTSHSPFLNIGLNEISPDRMKILSLPFGVQIRPSDDPQYSEVYALMLKEEGHFRALANALQNKISEHQENSKPLLITEGKTDIVHIKKAMQMLRIDDFNVEFFDGVEEHGGSDALRKLLEYRSRLPEGRIIVGIFDRDEPNIVNKVEEGGSLYKNYGNNVYAICLPATPMNQICSIEHYYPESILRKENDGRRLFTGDEFYPNGNSKDGHFYTARSLRRKIDINGIIDENIYKITDTEGRSNVALTKARFAELIDDDDFIDGFHFETFQPIFDLLKTIPGIASIAFQTDQV